MTNAPHHNRHIHSLVDQLIRDASKLAPRAAEEALDSGCTNLRPTGPRQAKAWDLVHRAYELNEAAGD